MSVFNLKAGILPLFVSLLMITGCKSQKYALESNKELSELSNTANLKMVKSSYNLQHLSLKIKTTYKEGTMEQSFTMNVKTIRDSVLWASVTAFGIEVTRILITKDSFKMIDRLQKQYVEGTVDQLKKLTKQDFSLIQVQELLIGNSLFKADGYVHKNDDLRKDHLYYKDSSVWNALRLTEGYRVKISELANSLNTQKATVDYGEFKRIKKFGSLPTLLNVELDGDNRKMLLNMQYVTISSDSIGSLSFTIPEKYAKRM